MTSNITLFDGMVIFHHVIQSGGFSAAANLTGHSTSYISKEINKLEQRVGARLLHRTTRSIGLTPEGEVFWQHCQQLIQDAEQALAQVRQAELEPKGNLKISCPLGFGSNYLKPILSKYLSLYPMVNLQLDLNDRKVDLVQDGYDLAIRATMELEASRLVCRKIYTCKTYTVASKAYLAKHGTPRQPQDLQHHDCICYANLKTPNRWVYQDSKGKDISVNVRSKMTCNNASMELAMVMEHHGICRLPAFHMEPELLAGQVEVILEDYTSPEINVYAVYVSRQHLSPKIRRLIDLISDELDPMPRFNR
ncbi:LysR family transcriptional regulator [Motilimonas pumila]|uniref:LysR family transcriptional regulator n=1 Tax=Motilimonas pumila TaxID=2303987 RepID=A0A418YKP1_9GAMM|nr:LysR family transcriptional regulator [Motilimonas pumila]RJG51519.1 LysR family transcriptional regulator [Motilimonas pumila]